MWLLCNATPLHAGEKVTSLWIDLGSGFEIDRTALRNDNIRIAAFARYRINRWEIMGGGWHAKDDDISNVTIGGGYVVPIWRGLNFTGGFALGGKTDNIGTVTRFYLAGRWDFRCWSFGYVHFSNGLRVFNHDRGPNEGVDLLVGGRKLHC